jgi:hypothetical protein
MLFYPELLVQHNMTVQNFIPISLAEKILVISPTFARTLSIITNNQNKTLHSGSYLVPSSGVTTTDPNN